MRNDLRPSISTLLDERLALWPIGRQEFAFDDLLLPIVGKRLAVSHQIHWSRDFHLCMVANFFLKALVDQAGKGGRDKSFKPDALGIDHFLMLVDNLSQCRELSVEQLLILLVELIVRYRFSLLESFKRLGPRPVGR